MKTIFYSILSAILLIGLGSCQNEDDSFGTGLLAFSSDTVNLNTVYPQFGSPTQQFKIYNRTNKSINIQTIELMNPSKSGFMINIDGEQGIRFSNVELLKGDSIFGFVQLKINEQASNAPTFILDSLRFTSGSNTQYLYLEAIGQNVYLFDNKEIKKDTTLTGDKPILVYGSLKIGEGVTVTMDENTRLLFHNKASLDVYGTINAKGTIEKPIVMQGDRTDVMDNYIPYQYVPGQWDGVSFYDGSVDNDLQNVQIRNAVTGVRFTQSSTNELKARLRNVVVENNTQNGVVATNCKIVGENCLFANSGGAALLLIGGDYSFNHCSIVNYYDWDKRTRSSLELYTYEGIASFPFVKCDLINSIIFGYFTNELVYPLLSNGTLNYRFVNCLIRNKEASTTNFANVLWNLNPAFRYVGDGTRFDYDFGLQATSAAIGKADKAYSALVPFDLNGNLRLADNAPDMGCYEWITE